jgi:hypothetical protein
MGLIVPKAEWHTTSVGLLASPNGQPASAHASAAHTERALAMVQPAHGAWHAPRLLAGGREATELISTPTTRLGQGTATLELTRDGWEVGAP